MISNIYYILRKLAKHEKVIENLKNLIEKYGDQIEILIGGGVRSENISALKKLTGGTSFHSSAILKYDTFVTEGEIKKLKQLSS